MLAPSAIGRPDQATDQATDQAPGAVKTLGKYELLRLLARGGMGEVHLARLPGELGFEKRLVIKTIRADLATDPRFVELFAAEAKTAVALSHPNIAPIYELGRAEDGSLYAAMGWVDGPSLYALIERLVALDRPLELGPALFIAREILDGLAHAHSPDRDRPPLVHRDITPRNVLVDRGGRVQIVDFGIAKPANAEVSGAMGSVGYMAPEQARGEPVDPRADVFGVACVLYELLTHARAFVGEGVWMLPSFAKIPAPVQPVLERALAIDPRHRFADAEAFLRALAPILAEHAPAFGTRDLAAILAELFEDGWEPTAANHDGAQTPATKATGAVQSFATRIDLKPESKPKPEPKPEPKPKKPATGPQAAPVLLAAPSRGSRPFAWSMLALLAGLLGYGLALLGGQTKPAAALLGPRAAGLGRGLAQLPLSPSLKQNETPSLKPNPNQPSPAWPTVELELIPADARVELGGRPLSGPPYTIALQGDEAVELSVEHPDFRGQLVALDPHAAPASPLRIELAPLEEGSLTVLAPSVAWAEVWLDDVRIGTTPLTAKPVREGKHRLVVRCTTAVCDAPQVLLDRSVRVRPGRTLELNTQR